MPFLGHPFRLLFATAQSLALVHVIYAHGLSIGSGWGPSMVPTFLINREWFVVDKRYRRGRGVCVGDCVTYAIPVEPGEEGVKRVMGMPGDYVLLNSPPSPPRASSSESGLGGGAIGGDLGYDRASRGIGSGNMIQVPKGHCYIVGDNLPWSRDSRDFGPIPLALIKGKVIAKACLDGWNPMNWFTRFENGLKKPADISDSSLSSQGP